MNCFILRTPQVEPRFMDAQKLIYVLKTQHNRESKSTHKPSTEETQQFYQPLYSRPDIFSNQRSKNTNNPLHSITTN